MLFVADSIHVAQLDARGGRSRIQGLVRFQCRVLSRAKRGNLDEPGRNGSVPQPDLANARGRGTILGLSRWWWCLRVSSKPTANEQRLRLAGIVNRSEHVLRLLRTAQRLDDSQWLNFVQYGLRFSHL